VRTRRPPATRAQRSSQRPVFIVDTREQRPYDLADSRIETLKTGDYSIAGLEGHVAIERKTKEDAYSSLGQGRGRFRAEVERLGRLNYGAIVIETSLSEFLRPPTFSRMSPRAAINTLLAWAVRYWAYRGRDAAEECRDEEPVLRESD